MRASRGEFAVAKHGYVASRCGWFSERSAGYMACGRPVITQSTGFESWLPTGLGLLSFTDLQGALDAVAIVEANYNAHAMAARNIAEAEFDGQRVLSDLVSTVT